MPNLGISNVGKVFESDGNSTRVLDKLNLSVETGSIVAIEGASGSGKSTLLNLIATIDTPSTGKISYGDKILSQFSTREKEKFRAQNLGFIFQHYCLLPDFSVLENVMMPLLICKNSWSFALEKSRVLLDLVGLDNRKSHFPSQISGGEMARVGVARALVGEKDLVLADEPTGNLDKSNSEKLADLLWSLQQKLNFTLIIVTHDRDFAARASQRYQLSSGNLAQ